MSRYCRKHAPVLSTASRPGVQLPEWPGRESTAKHGYRKLALKCYNTALCGVC